MLKRLFFATAIVLCSALNAAATDDSFSLQVAREQQATVWTLWQGLDNDLEKFTKSSIEIVASQEGTDFDSLIVKTIKELAKELDPKKATQMYFDSVKKTLNKALAAANFEPLVSAQNDDEAKQALGNMLQQVFGAITSKDVALEQAIYFATFTDEMVKETTATVSSCVQEFIVKMNQIEDKEVIATEMKKLLDEYFANTLNSIAIVLEKHGYAIDR